MKAKILKVRDLGNCIKIVAVATINGVEIQEVFKIKHEKVQSGEYKEILKNYFEGRKDRDAKATAQALDLEGKTITL